MPEATPAAVAPTQSSHPNAPQNGATPPAAGATNGTPPPVAGEPDITARFKTLETEHQKKVREHIIERRKWDGERKTLSEKAARADALEKREQSAKLNPVAYLKELYGEQWHEMVTEAKVNGVTPAALVQQEMQKLRDELADKERVRAEEGTKAQEAQKQEAQQQARQSIFAECAAFYRGALKDYPIFAKVKGGEPAVAAMLARRIESEFHATGKILKTSEVADLVESEVVEWAAEAGKHDKYKPKLQPASASSTVNASKQQQGTQQPAAARRSITNDITGSTSSRKPPADEKERAARADAAWNAVKAKAR